MILRPIGLVCICVALLCAVTGVPSEARAAEHRIGLVIGEASYRAGALATPANDAGIVAQALASDGFEVTGYADLDLAGTRRAFSDFLVKAREAGPDGVAVVYLSGYGVQFDGDDFLVPVDARIARDVDVPGEAVRLGDFARDLAALPLKARILVYDLARPHPFAQGGIPLASGLAMVDPQAGSLVAFNTAPGLVAPSEQGDYGLYAEALSEMLRTKGLSIDMVFSRLRARVNALSNGGAVPWTEGTLDTPLVLLPPATDAPSLLSPLRALIPGGPTDAYWTAIQRDTLPSYSEVLKADPRDPLSPRIAVLLAARREAATWAQTRRANIAAAYWTYMRRYPRGPHFPDARRGLAALPAALEPPPRFDLYAFADLPTPHPDEVALINRPFVQPEVDDEAPVPPPPPTIVPDRRPEFYGLLPPLLAVSAGTLPLPTPLGGAFEPGRIVQPDLNANVGPVSATEGVDKVGDPIVRQTGADGRMLSTAIKSTAPNGGSVVTQTGPDDRPVLTMVAVVGPNGARTVTQTGRDNHVVATTTTFVAPNGNRVTTVSGPDGLPRSIVTTTVAGVVLNSRSLERHFAAAGAPTRPVVLPASGVALAKPPPLLASVPIPQGAVAPAPPYAAISSVSPPLPSAAPVAGTSQRAVSSLVVPKDVVAPSAPSLPSITPTMVPDPAAPAMTPMAPIAMPTIAIPAAALPPPRGVPVAPPVSAVAPPLPAPGPVPALAPADHGPAAVAEPIPPRKGPEPVAAAKALPSPTSEGHRDKATTADAQPTPPRRPQAQPVKAASAKGAPKASRATAKPALKKSSAGRRAPSKHRS